MSAGHTPGPLVAELHGTMPNGVKMWWLKRDEISVGCRNDADAILYAAAPELLEALVRLIPADFDEHPDDFMDDWHQARAALARARGETPEGEMK